MRALIYIFILVVVIVFMQNTQNKTDYSIVSELFNAVSHVILSSLNIIKTILKV